MELKQLNCKNRTYVLLPILLLIKIVSFGQQVNNNYLPVVSPVSPKAFEFIKYTDIPVSKYTGIPNISIPLFELKTDAYSMPISLSYHSNGFRVTEEAGWTGLGWNLNVGGSIVQVVNGFDDFGVFKNRDNELQPMVNASPGMPNSILSTCTTVNFWVQGQEENYALIWPPNNGALNYQANTALLNGTKDVEPDIFKFTVGDFSGDFLLDWQSETFKCITDANVKIEAVASSTPQNFMITSPDGTRYYFQMKEQTTITKIVYEGGHAPNLTISQSILGQVSSRVYHLTSIITNNAELISLNYTQTGPIENYPSINENLIFNRKELMYPNNQGDVQPRIDSYFPNSQLLRTINYSRQNFSYLSSINFPTGTINFISSDDRTDLIGARKLNKIEIVNSKSEIIKEVQFNYDYFFANTTGNNYDAYLQYPSSNPVYSTNKQASELSQRLKLLSINEFNIPAYQFEYHSEQLPKKTSLATDHWGFSNGKITNNSYLPNIWMNGIEDDNLTGIENNRNSDFLSTKAAVIKKITYPTGGSSSFDYELNTFDNFKISHDDYSSKTSVFLNDRNNLGNNLAQVFYSDLPSVLYNGEMSISTYGPMSGSTTPNSAYIRLTVLQKTQENLNLVSTGIASFWAIYHSTPFNQLGNHINNVVSDSKLLSFEWNQATQSYETFKLKTGEVIKVLPQFIYILHAYLDDSFGPQTNQTQGANASAYFTFLKNNSYSLSKGGGLRIKSIKSESNSSPPVIKSYSYFGGKLMSPLIYYTKNAIEFEHGQNFYPNDGQAYYDEYKYRVITSTANSASFYTPSTNASGKFIGYDRVEETNSVVDNSQQLVNNLNGKIVEEFTNTPDVGVLDPTFYPSTGDPNATNPLNFIYPARKAIIENGLTLKSKYYNSQNALIKEIENNYSPTSQQCGYGRVSATRNVESNLISVAHNLIAKARIYGIGAYPIVGNKTLLGNSIIKEYSNGNIITSQIINSYDIKNQLSTTVVTNSEQNSRKTTYKYPYNYPSYSALANAMITPVIEQKEELITSGGSTKPISVIQKDYFFTGGATQSGTWQLQQILKGLGNNLPESDVVFDLYGESTAPDKYKLRQFHDKSGIITSVIWGYSGQFPVAKIVGKEYPAAIVESGISLTTINNSSITDAALRTELNILRQLTNCFVTTYTYKPLVGITSETDPNGRTKFYEYDAFNRLVLIRDQDGKVLRKICYNYAGQPEDCSVATPPPVYYNVQMSQAFTRNNCPACQTGSQVTYTVAQGTYSSTVSQVAADQLAQNDIAANGQNYANTNGSCTQGSGVTITYQNETSATGFVALYTNNSTGQTYSFNVPASGSGTLGCVPSGTYSLSISKPGNMMLALFGSGCFTQSGTSAFFGKVNVSTCNTVIIGYDL